MERNLAEMKVVREKWGMKMHWEKTKVYNDDEQNM